MINLKNNREHLPLVGKVGLEWRTDCLNGRIEVKTILFFEATVCIIKKNFCLLIHRYITLLKSIVASVK
jgi:hypothetical protein